MKKGYKKGMTALSSLLAISMLAAACSSDNGETGGSTNAGNAGNAGDVSVSADGFPIVEETITLSLLAPSAEMADWSSMPTIQAMEELSNIKVEFQTAPIDSFPTRKNLMFASGELPDMLYAADLTPAEQVNYGTQGLLIPLEDLIDNYAPNLKAVLDANPDVRKSITTTDGHIYALPFIDTTAVWYRGPMWYNGKFLEALGASEPQTTEELYQYLKRVKEEDPNGNGEADEIPLTSVKLDDLRMYFLGFWGIYNEVYYSDSEGVVHYTPQEEGYLGYLTFLNRLWEEELLDHETFSQTDDMKKAKGSKNQVALFSDYHPYFTLGGEPRTTDPMMTPVSSEIAGTPVYGKHPGISSNGNFAITSSNSHPEATMRWIDYQYGYEGATLWTQGPEGLMWEYEDEANKVKRFKEVPGGGDREEYRATLTPNYGIVTPGVNIPELTNGLRSELDDWIIEQNEEKLVPIAKPPFPRVYLSNERQTEVSALMSDLDTYVKQMEARFVTGVEPLSNWETYVAQLKRMGSDRVVEIYQEAYDQWDSENAS
ncbi:extracellular solute-binding protein [Paenibacillus sp. 1P07SE]|uniref:extracellular solute-binding protein n=1 Tax=Paenibacillus sp. 1P07SE TaxID=3132209 RepID=UPI0039A68074